MPPSQEKEIGVIWILEGVEAGFDAVTQEQQQGVYDRLFNLETSMEKLQKRVADVESHIPKKPIRIEQ